MTNLKPVLTEMSNPFLIWLFVYKKTFANKFTLILLMK